MLDDDDAGIDRLRVSVGGAPAWDVPISDRLAVGSGQSCDLVVVGLRPLHFVIERIHEDWLLSCFGGAEVHLTGGLTVRRLPLTPGSVFAAGPARFELVGGARPVPSVQ